VKNNIKLGADLPLQIRVSLGSAVVLQLMEGRVAVEPTTVYLMTYKDGKCNANCSFCSQARNSRGKIDMLSRVTWPTFQTKNVLTKIRSGAEHSKIKRVCIQALNYPRVFMHLVALIKALKHNIPVPVSVSCQPLVTDNIQRLAKAGADRIGIALDAATEQLFERVKGSWVKGPYSWSEQFMHLRNSVSIFGEGNVSTHLIVGLGETEKEAVQIIQKCKNMGVLPALFAFTPIRGTALTNSSPPLLESYRRIQLARHLIVNGNTLYSPMTFDSEDNIEDFGVCKTQLTQIVDTGLPFLTSGCPDCNRPFYTEKPRGPIYNFPRNLDVDEISAIKRQLNL
jgi:lipoyl synthase